MFADSSVEWPEATREQRLEYLFPIKARVAVVAELVISAGAAVLGGSLWEDLLLGVLLFALGILPFLMRLLNCWLEIKRSVARYESGQLTEAGYRPREHGETIFS